MTYLRMPYTDRSGTEHPEAIFEIVGLHLNLTQDGISGDVQVHVFHDLNTRNDSKPPFEERPPTALTTEEILALEDQFRLAIYQTLQARPEYSGSLVVP